MSLWLKAYTVSNPKRIALGITVLVAIGLLSYLLVNTRESSRREFVQAEWKQAAPEARYEMVWSLAGLSREKFNTNILSEDSITWGMNSEQVLSLLGEPDSKNFFMHYDLGKIESSNKVLGYGNSHYNLLIRFNSSDVISVMMVEKAGGP